MILIILMVDNGKQTNSTLAFIPSRYINCVFVSATEDYVVEACGLVGFTLNTSFISVLDFNGTLLVTGIEAKAFGISIRG